MAETIGDIIGRNFRAGRAIGQDFSEWRYNRGEAKLREQYAAEAQQAGVDLNEYLSDPKILTRFETDLDSLYTSSGARKRGVVADSSGNTLADLSRSRTHRDVARVGARKAASQTVEGDVEGGFNTQARIAGALGNADEARSRMQAGQQVQATAGSVKQDGTIDRVKLAKNVGGVQARFGDAAGAAQSEGARQDFLLDVAKGLAGNLAMMLDNPAQFADQIRGTFENLKEYMPQIGSFDLQVDPQKNTTVIYQNGQPVGALDDPEEIRGMLEAFQRDPRSVLDQWRQTQLGVAQQTRERTNQLQDKYLESASKVIEAFKGAGVDATTATQLVSAQNKALEAGWKSLGQSEDGIITATAPDGRIIKILPAQADGQTPDGRGVVPGAASRIIDAATGQTLSPADLGADANSITEFATALQAAQMDAAFQRNAGTLKMQLQLLGDLYGQSRGEASNASSALPGSPTAGKVGGALGGGVTRDFPFPETDNYVKTIVGNTGKPQGTSEEVAAQVFDALVHQESRGKQSAISPKGARGVAQLMPETARMLERQLGLPPGSTDTDPEANRQAGMVYLTQMLDRYNGDLELALAAYNAGPGAVDGWIQSGRVAGPQVAAADPLGPKVDYATGGYGYRPPAQVSPVQVASNGLPRPLNFRGGGELDSSGAQSGAPLAGQPGSGSYDPQQGMTQINDIARRMLR